jgi:hypothetical protein
MTCVFNRCPEHRSEKQTLWRKALYRAGARELFGKAFRDGRHFARETDRHRRVEDFAERKAQPHPALHYWGRSDASRERSRHRAALAERDIDGAFEAPASQKASTARDGAPPGS